MIQQAPVKGERGNSGSTLSLSPLDARNGLQKKIPTKLRYNEIVVMRSMGKSGLRANAKLK
jgi:hypothetical protein